MATIGHALKREIESYAKKLVESNALFLATERGEITAEHVKTYVSGVLFQIRSTMGVLRRAELRSRSLGYEALAAHYREKIREELGHDRWAERDLDRLPAGGPDYGTDGARTALGDLVQYLDEAVDRDPCLFLSYILLSEYLTVLVGPAWLRALEQKCDVAQSRMTVVGNHVELDGEHAEEGIRQIDVLVSSPDKAAAMLEVLRASLGYYERFWDEVLSSSARRAA